MNHTSKFPKFYVLYHNHFSNRFWFFQRNHGSDTTVGFHTCIHSGNNKNFMESSNNMWPLKESKFIKDQVKEITLEDRFTVFSSDRYWVVANHSDPQAGTPPRYLHKVVYKWEAWCPCASKLIKLGKKMKRMKNMKNQLLILLSFSLPLVAVWLAWMRGLFFLAFIAIWSDFNHIKIWP